MRGTLIGGVLALAACTGASTAGATTTEATSSTTDTATTTTTPTTGGTTFDPGVIDSFVYSVFDHQ